MKKGERQKENIIITREGEKREQIKARVKEKSREGGRERERGIITNLFIETMSLLNHKCTIYTPRLLRHKII